LPYFDLETQDQAKPAPTVKKRPTRRAKVGVSPDKAAQ
jgi:hypothetical protein